ncbi:MAG: STAS domain-containing protein [Dehalococcoidia bacterium]
MAEASVILVQGNLIVTIPQDVGDNEALDLQVRVNETIEARSPGGLLVDISNLETVDSFLGRLLHDLATGAHLLGAETVVVGMQPAVAMTLVELGLELRGVRTALDADRGLAMLGDGGGGSPRRGR